MSTASRAEGGGGGGTGTEPALGFSPRDLAAERDMLARIRHLQVFQCPFISMQVYFHVPMLIHQPLLYVATQNSKGHDMCSKIIER